MSKQIGLSLSFCVLDIAFGKKKECDVTKIVAGTRASTPEEWEEVLSQYADTYWQSRGCDPIAAVAIARRLVDEGKVEQPRLLDSQRYPVIRGNHWVSSESEIIWSDEER